MYQGFVHVHNSLRWVILVLLLLVLVQALTKKEHIRKTSLWLLIASHLMLLIGLYQYFTGDYGFGLITASSIGEVMKNKVMRFWAVEHILSMLISIVLITIARNRSKHLKYTAAAALYAIALLLILSAIPWPFRVDIGRPLFPGMH